MKTVFFSLCLLFCAGCGHREARQERKAVQQAIIPIKKEQLTNIGDLQGIWTNSNFDSIKYGRISYSEFGFPCTGFSIEMTGADRLSVYILYVEKSIENEFTGVHIKRGVDVDTLLGKFLKKEIPIAYIYSKNEIDLRVMDYTILAQHSASTNVRYSKISEQPCKGELYSAIVFRLFEVLPLNLTIDGQPYSIRQVDDHAVKKGYCGFIHVKGFKEYTTVELTGYKYDSVSKEQIFQLFFANGDKHEEVLVARNENKEVRVLPFLSK